MQSHYYGFGALILGLGTGTIAVLPGCSDNTSLGEGLPLADASIQPGPTDGSASAGSGGGSGDATASGGAPSGGGATGTGGALASTGTGGAAQGGTSGTVVDGKVTLIASVPGNGGILPTWQNGTNVSVFLYGCGSADLWKRIGSDWVLRGSMVLCNWEGVSPEVRPGTSYTEDSPAYSIPASSFWGDGVYRLQGKYGVGCTHPEKGQSRAGCTAFYELISNEVNFVVPNACPKGPPGSGTPCSPEGVVCGYAGSSVGETATCKSGIWVLQSTGLDQNYVCPSVLPAEGSPCPKPPAPTYSGLVCGFDCANSSCFGSSTTNCGATQADCVQDAKSGEHQWVYRRLRVGCAAP